MTARWSVGSKWLRWDPHIHAPGTLLNDQFGKDDWPAYLRLIETADPPVIALGITDYFTMRSYKEMFRLRQSGALASVPLVFANIELRLSQPTRKGQGVNLHLLVSPDEDDHIKRMEELLMQLKFEHDGKHYPCSDEALIRLGRTVTRDPLLPDAAALSRGANQFKVELSAVRLLFNDQWCLENVLVAVAAGDDGLTGFTEDASFYAYRQDLGRFAHIIFSGSPSDRKYWAGDHPKFKSDGHTPKPCLVGCDAHELSSVLKPSAAGVEGEPRRCWIRGGVTFESLRQALIEPSRRVSIGASPPGGPSPGNVIKSLRVENADWFLTPAIELNDGLVTIIGSRGSGKTALADLIALAADADAETFHEDPNSASFIAKASPLLADVRATITWGDGSQQTRGLPNPFESDSGVQPRVRYLSQKFVEKLCSPGEASSEHGEPLTLEIEHVVFNAIREEDRLQCTTFEELRSLRLAGCFEEEDEVRVVISDRTRSIADQHELLRALPARKIKLQEAMRVRAAIEADLAKIPTKANDATVKAHGLANDSLNALQTLIGREQRNELAVNELTASVERQVRAADAAWEALKTKYAAVLPEVEWPLLRLKPDATATSVLERMKLMAAQRVANLRMHGALQKTEGVLGLEAREQKVKELTAALGLDHANAKRRIDLARRLGAAKQAEQKAAEDVAAAEKASGVLKQLRDERAAAYRRIFQAFLTHEETLRSLYEPLQSLLSKEPALQKISFAVERVVDLRGWAANGEELFDLRKKAPFAGEGELAKKAQPLLQAWKMGTPDDVTREMAAFLRLVLQQQDAQGLAQGVSPVDVGEWLFSTEHISVQYAIRYDGLELRQLSPGTRGIVLLTLYLGLDRWDDRPLLIDQPEENLDPRSVFLDLVPFFKVAAQRRQILMVTHNPNLVVNTDSDQVIIADSSRRGPGQLPDVSYIAGGLEDPEIRGHVCRVLEGGEEAFERRRRQYKALSD